MYEMNAKNNKKKFKNGGIKMLEIALEFLSENIIQLLLSGITVILVWIGKPKSAAKLQKLKQKRYEKVKKEINTTLENLKLLNKESKKLEKELAEDAEE